MPHLEPPLDRRAVLLRGVGVILFASILFGAMAMFVRMAAREMGAMQIAFVRFFGSLLVLLLVAPHRGLRPRAGNLPRLLQRGLLGASSIVLYFFGIEHIGAGFATLLQCTYPVFTALFAVTLMEETISSRLVVALGLNLLGVVAVLGPGSDLPPALAFGALSSIAAAVFAGGAVATARHLRASENASLITIYFMAVGAAVTAPALLLGLPPLTAPLAIALTGVVLTSAAGQWMLHHGLGFASATQGSLAAATSVVTAAGLEALFLGEHLKTHTLFGTVFMVAAVGLAVSASRPVQPRLPPAVGPATDS